ncbi:MAG: hypothetical protein HY694_13795 [Deltaproteobacteria bacterium]|nr:hypothetical protein [Deltaproteobacteria bacterium]
MNRKGVTAQTVSSMFFVFLFPVLAFSQAPFYQGKTITLIAGVKAGDTGDMRARVIVAFLRKYIPGTPTIIMQYMPGGGGRAAANHIYNVARPDGLTAGRVASSIVSYAVLGEPGVRYDVDRLIYLGASESVLHYALFTRREAGLDSLQKLRSNRGVRIGTLPVGHTHYILGRLFAYFIGMKEPKFVPGYGGEELNLALMAGEVDARVSTLDSTLKEHPDFLEKGLMDFHAVVGIPHGQKHPRFPHLPEIESFAKTEKERKLLAMFRAFRGIGSPVILPPRTHSDRLQILQEAMRKTLRDPDFHKEYQKNLGEDPSPLMPEEQVKIIREIPRDPEIVELFKRFAGVEPLPLR